MAKTVLYPASGHYINAIPPIIKKKKYIHGRGDFN